LNGELTNADDIFINADAGPGGYGGYGGVILQKADTTLMTIGEDFTYDVNIYTNTYIASGGTPFLFDTAGMILESGTGAGIGYTNSLGNTHGLWVDGSQTMLSGGTNSSVLTLADGDAGGTTLTVGGSDITTINPTVFSATTDAYGYYANTVVGSGANWGDTTTIQGYGADLNLGYGQATLSADNDVVLNVNNNGMSYGGLVVYDVGYATTVMEIYSNAQGGSDLYSTLDMNGNQIHGLAAGTVGTDAVNLNQLNNLENDMSKGIAATTAIANIPQVEAGKKASVGLGYGHYNGENAIAAGASWHFGAASNGIMKVSVGTGGSGETAVGAGASWSW
ncbi:MAG: YadA C-terminal domain-containing protein, partial [Campylobacterales bacterium]|nr:YadA C-terminal domain-containing protein [Campylobacterales bacterium]